MHDPMDADLGSLRIRTLAARIIRAVAVLAACCLLGAAILIAVKANANNGLVELIKHLASVFSLGLFSLSNPLKTFTGANGAAETALLTYGVGAAAWLVIGNLIARLLRR